ALPGVVQGPAHAGDEVREAGGVGRIELQRDRLAAERLDLRNQGACLLGVAAIGGDDVAARMRDRERGLTAEPAAGAGDQGDGGHGWLLSGWGLQVRRRGPAWVAKAFPMLARSCIAPARRPPSR